MRCAVRSSAPVTEYSISTPQRWPSSKWLWITSGKYPRSMRIRSNPWSRSISTMYSRNGLPWNSTIGLGRVSVIGRSRVPRPPARITAWVGRCSRSLEREANISRRSSRVILCQAVGQDVADDRVGVLDQLVSALLRGQPDALADQVLQNAAVEAEQADRDGTSAAGHLDRSHEVRRVPARRDHNQQVVVPSEVVQLAREDLVVPVVV